MCFLVSHFRFNITMITQRNHPIFEFFTVCTKFAEMAILYSKDLTTAKKSYLQWDSTWCKRLSCTNCEKLEWEHNCRIMTCTIACPSQSHMYTITDTKTRQPNTADKPHSKTPQPNLMETSPAKLFQ